MWESGVRTLVASWKEKTEIHWDLSANPLGCDHDPLKTADPQNQTELSRIKNKTLCWSSALEIFQVLAGSYVLINCHSIHFTGSLFMVIWMLGLNHDLLKMGDPQNHTMCWKYDIMNLSFIYFWLVYYAWWFECLHTNK